MSKVKQPNYLKVPSTLHEYASEFTSTVTKGDLSGKFYDCLVRIYKKLWWNHIAPVRSIKEVRFMKLKLPGFSKGCYVYVPDFADKLLLFISTEQT